MTAPTDAAAVLREMLARRADYLSQGISTYPALLAVERRLCEAAPAVLSELDKLREREARLTGALEGVRYNGHSADELRAAVEHNHHYTLASAVPALFAHIDAIAEVEELLRAHLRDIQDAAKQASREPGSSLHVARVLQLAEDALRVRAALQRKEET